MIQEPALQNSLQALKMHHLSRFCALAFKKPCENQHLKNKWYAPCEAFNRSKNKVVCALRGISKLEFISVHHSQLIFFLPYAPCETYAKKYAALSNSRSRRYNFKKKRHFFRTIFSQECFPSRMTHHSYA